MKDSIYVLCFKGKTKKGKYDICPLYKDTLNLIDQFTTYGYGKYKCSDDKNLFNALPANVKNFIESYFIINESTIKDCFFIRKDAKDIRKGRTNLPVLFYNDADIVYANANEVLESLLFFNVPLEEFSSEDEITKLKKSFFEDLFQLLSLNADSALTDEIDNIIRIENDFSLTRLKGIICIPEVLIEIAKYSCKDYLLKRKVLSLIKEYKIKLYKIITCNINFLNNLELYSRIRNRKFNYDLAIKGSFLYKNGKYVEKYGSFNEMLQLNKDFFGKKYGFIINDDEKEKFDLEKEIKNCNNKVKELNNKLKNSSDKTLKKIITMLIKKLNLKIISLKNNEDYNKYESEILKIDRLKDFYESLNNILILAKDETYIKIIAMIIEQIKLKIEFQEKINDDFNSNEVDYDKCESKILELDVLRMTFENLYNESAKSRMLSKRLIHLKINKFDLEKSLEESIKTGDEDLIDYYSKKIADCEEQIISLENGDFYYSDAGILVRREDMGDDMKM